MPRILKRPMFSRGGSTNENNGIMTGLVDRKGYAEDTGIDSRVVAPTQAEIYAKEYYDQLSKIQPPKSRLNLGKVGLNLAAGKYSGGDLISTLAGAGSDIYDDYTAKDDVRRNLDYKTKMAAAKMGISKADAEAIAKAKALAKGSTRTLSEPEAKAMGFPAGSIVQQKADGTISVPLKPSAKQMEQRTNLEGTIGLLNKIELNYNKAGKPVGKAYNFDPDRLSGEIGKFTGSEQGKTFATLQADIQKTTVFLTKAISGAQVSDKEREFIEKLIPSIGDTEVQFEAKLKSLRSYLGDAAKRYGGDVEAMMKAGVSAEDYFQTTEPSKDLEKMSDEELEAYRDSLLNEG